MSGGGFGLRDVFPVAPRGGLVLAGAGLEAALQDAGKPAGQSAQGVVMLKSLGAGHRRRLGPGEARSAAKAWIISASMSRSLRTYRAATIFFLPRRG
jgi:hypothetical protein